MQENVLTADSSGANSEKITQMQKLQDSMVAVFADIIESRDNITSGHIERVIKCLKILTEALIRRGKYTDELSKLDLDIFYSAAQLYDIGKIFISDSILNKSGKLTFDEFETMKTHAIEGECVFDQIDKLTKTNFKFLEYARLFAGYHHERWDGNGYPRGLDKLNIPIHGRIMAIIDVYVALVSERPFKKAFTPEDAVKIVMDSTDEMFDPEIAEIFFEEKEKFKDI
ncbi:MAG: HD domain-containing protein [Treponema sp.]|nr:HD domain-containing protein [Treponema sp.]MCL2272056.1 HD domain-containing protein [Treponema sp.]